MSAPAEYKVVVNGDGFAEPLEVEYGTEAEARAAQALAMQIMKACSVPRPIHTVKAYRNAGWMELGADR